MAWHIEFVVSSDYELDEEPTEKDKEDFLNCFIDDLISGYISTEISCYNDEE